MLLACVTRLRISRVKKLLALTQTQATLMQKRFKCKLKSFESPETRIREETKSVLVTISMENFLCKLELRQRGSNY